MTFYVFLSCLTRFLEHWGKPSSYLTSHPGQLSLAIPPWVGAMSTSESGDVNRHTARCTSPVSVVWQCKLVSGWGLMKRRSAPLYGPYGSGRTLRFLCNLQMRLADLLGRRAGTERNQLRALDTRARRTTSDDVLWLRRDRKTCSRRVLSPVGQTAGSVGRNRPDWSQRSAPPSQLCTVHTIRYDTIYYLRWKTDRQAASLI